MPALPNERLQGTLDLLVLRSLTAGPLHGWSIADRIQVVSREILSVGQGSLYPALHRLESRGWVSAEWGVADTGRRARFYRLTAQGRRQLEVERESWNAFVEAVRRVLQYA
jgi:transcriptional regulator